MVKKWFKYDIRYIMNDADTDTDKDRDRNRDRDKDEDKDKGGDNNNNRFKKTNMRSKDEMAQ